MLYADRKCTYVETLENGENFYTFTGPCTITKKTYSVKVPGKGLYAYRQGALIQDAFPTLSADDREFLQTGYSPEGWKQIFGDAEDEQDGDDEEDDDCGETEGD